METDVKTSTFTQGVWLNSETCCPWKYLRPTFLKLVFHTLCWWVSCGKFNGQIMLSIVEKWLEVHSVFFHTSEMLLYL